VRSPLPESQSLQQLADACVHCGLCLPHCPTYADAKLETESPRGRILLASALGSGRLGPLEADADQALSHCLGCRACELVCPAKVEYGQLLGLTRQVLRRELPAPRWQRALEWLLMHPRWLRAGMPWLRLAARLPGLRQRIPPPPVAPALPAVHPAQGARRGRLALVQGCVAAHWEAPAHHAALTLLSRLGWEVIVLAPACCGALHRHAGAAAAAEQLAQALTRQITASGADQVVHAGSGCHEAIARAASPVPCHELSTLLADDGELARLQFRPASLRVGLHTACTQRTVVRRPDTERLLLQRIPGLQLCAPAPTACCGAAGIQSLRFPQQSEQRMQAVREWYREQAPDLLLAGNLGCRLQLARLLAPEQGIIKIEHPLVLLVRHLS
jgi:glycolate oxidase iron-sulfur subunit